jgi:hypothetical protein
LNAAEIRQSNEATHEYTYRNRQGPSDLAQGCPEASGCSARGKIAVDKLPDGRIELKAARPTGKISDAFGFLKGKDRPSLSIEEISKAASSGWAGKR